MFRRKLNICTQSEQVELGMDDIYIYIPISQYDPIVQ